MKSGKESELSNVLKLFRNKKILLVILFDILFLVSITATSFLVNSFLPKTNILNFIENRISIILLALSITIIYILLLIFIYSFFKYNILDFISSMFKKTELNLKRLTQFYFLNIIIIGSTVIIILILGWLLFLLLKQQYVAETLFVLSIPIILLAYSLTNITHSIFWKHKKLKDILSNGLSLTFKSIKNYIKVYLIDIVIIICFLILFYLAILIAGNSFIARNFINSLFSLIAFIVFYFIILFNRLYLYIVINNKM